jgi:hypothetical protein
LLRAAGAEPSDVPPERDAAAVEAPLRPPLRPPVETERTKASSRAPR